MHFTLIPPEIQGLSSTRIVSRRSPQLTNGHNLAGIYELPWVNTMPIGDMFLNVMYKSWDIQANRRREILSPRCAPFREYLLYMSYAFLLRALLAVLGQKYDQYLDFAQQDAHEFLRILLDAMRMEEQDVSFFPSLVPQFIQRASHLPIFLFFIWICSHHFSCFFFINFTNVINQVFAPPFPSFAKIKTITVSKLVLTILTDN